MRAADVVCVRRLETGIALPGEEALRVAVEVRVPAQRLSPDLAFVCLPGGGMNRRFFDLMPSGAGNDERFSFARQVAARGLATILVDHLGVGDSSRPRDVYTLTPELLAEANAKAVDQVCTELRAGSFSPEMPAMPELVTIGLGHSMGAVLTVLGQAQRPSHAALALLGFSTRGLPEYLIPQARALAHDAATARAQLAELARASFGEYAKMRRANQSGELYAAERADPRGIEALKVALAPMLPLPAMLAMLPGNVAQEAARIEVPVFIGAGEFDLIGDAKAVPASFPASRALTLHILREAGHSHFLFPARRALFDALADWAQSSVKH